MNYCNPVWEGGGVLSSTDVGGAQNYYHLGVRFIAAMIVTSPNS